MLATHGLCRHRGEGRAALRKLGPRLRILHTSEHAHLDRVPAAVWPRLRELSVDLTYIDVPASASPRPSLAQAPLAFRKLERLALSLPNVSWYEESMRDRCVAYWRRRRPAASTPWFWTWGVGRCLPPTTASTASTKRCGRMRCTWNPCASILERRPTPPPFVSLPPLPKAHTLVFSSHYSMRVSRTTDGVPHYCCCCRPYRFRHSPHLSCL